VAVAQANAPEAGLLGGAEGFFRVLAGSCREVGKKKRWCEGQERVGNVGMEGGDELGKVLDLLGIHVARHQEGSSDEQRWLGPFQEARCSSGEVLQGPPVGHPGQSPVDTIVPRFEVELEDPTALQGQFQRAVEQMWIHTAIGFPADPYAPLGKRAGHGECVGHLGGGVAAEETDALRAGVRPRGQFLRTEGV